VAANGRSLRLSMALMCAACTVQYAGLLAERSFIFAEVRYPQNLNQAQIS
jgi:hypothetical protein